MRPPTIWNAKPGWINRSVPPDCGVMAPPPSRAAASSARVVVVPTAITRRPSRLAAAIAFAAALADLEVLGIHRVRLHVVHAYRLKRAVADVQRDGRPFYSALASAVEDRVAEVQSGRRRRHRSTLAGIDSLVPLAIARQSSARAMYGGSGTWPSASIASSTLARVPLHSRMVRRPWKRRSRISACRTCVSLRNSTAEPELSFWPGCTSASHRSSSTFRQQQALDGAAARHAFAEEPRGKHLRIVEHQQIAVPEQIGQARDARVLERRGASSKHEQLRRAPGSGGLRDEAMREIEIEVSSLHG